jgi:hypothetical protein
MVVICKAVLKEFAEKHPDAETALFKWYNKPRLLIGETSEISKGLYFIHRYNKEYDKIDASGIELKG